jgi:hypothetical protein
MIMIASTKAAESIPIPSGGPLNKGMLFSHGGVAISIWLTKARARRRPRVRDGLDGGEQLSEETSARPRRRELGERMAIPGAIGVEIRIARTDE